MGLDITVGKNYKMLEKYDKYVEFFTKTLAKQPKFFLYLQEAKNRNCKLCIEVVFAGRGKKNKTKKQPKKPSHVAISTVKIKRKECGMKGDTPVMEAGRERDHRKVYLFLWFWNDARY